MSGFEQDNFLGRSSSSDLAAEIDALKERALFRDGTKSMTGNLGMADNQIIATKDMNLSPQVTGATPATGINIYTKADNILYKKTRAGVESAVGGGGGNVVARLLFVGDIHLGRRPTQLPDDLAAHGLAPLRVQQLVPKRGGGQ